MTEKGRFVWYDLSTTEPDRAIAFYTETVGWKTKEWQGKKEPYIMFAIDDRPIGGVMELSDEAREMGAPPHWLAYVKTPDVGATTEQARELGATIHVEAEEIPQVGTFSVIQDPQGAVFAAFTPEDEEMDTPEMGTVGAVSWHELMTTDVDAAWDFYSELFDWEITDSMDMGDWTYQMYGDGESTYGGIGQKSGDIPASPSWVYYITVEDLDAALERVRNNGGEVVNGPMSVPGGDRVAQCMDPEGVVFALHMLA